MDDFVFAYSIVGAIVWLWVFGRVVPDETGPMVFFVVRTGETAAVRANEDRRRNILSR